MDYFEATVAKILEEQGYWVRQSVRVELTKEVKRSLGKPNLPRPEIDIVAFQPIDRALVLFEVKSYLDSTGVHADHLLGTDWEDNRYKILTIPTLQGAVSKSLLEEYMRRRLVPADSTVKYGLAVGHIQPGQEDRVKEIAKQNSWVYLGPEDIAAEVWKFADRGYENSPFVLIAKILARNPPAGSRTNPQTA